MKDNQSQKKDQYHVWRLMGRKLAGNASKSELQELQELLLDNPHIQYSMEILLGLSDPGKGSNGEANGNSRTLPQNRSTLPQEREPETPHNASCTFFPVATAK